MFYFPYSTWSFTSDQSELLRAGISRNLSRSLSIESLIIYHIFPTFGSILDHAQVLGDLGVHGSGSDLALDLLTVDCLGVGRVSALWKLWLLGPVLAV